MVRDIDIGDHGQVPNLRPSHGRTIKDLLLVATALAAVGGWLWKAARAQVDATEMENVKAEMRATAAAMDRRVSAIEKDVAVTTVKVDQIKQSADRIENKLDEKHRR